MFKALVGGLTLSLLPLAAGAQELDSGDTAWMLTASVLVLFMLLPGLSLFYAGLVRSKNTLSVVMQCFSIASVASLIWFVIGYSLAFTDGGSMNWFIGGTSKAFLSGVTFDSMIGTIPESVFIVFQMTFVMITAALFGAAALSGVGLDGSIGEQLSIQAIGVIAAVGYTAIVSYILFRVVNALTPLRVDEEEQRGLDLVCHDEKGYNF